MKLRNKLNGKAVGKKKLWIFQVQMELLFEIMPKGPLGYSFCKNIYFRRLC